MYVCYCVPGRVGMLSDLPLIFLLNATVSNVGLHILFQAEMRFIYPFLSVLASAALSAGATGHQLGGR